MSSLTPSVQNIELAKVFLLKKWQERAREMHRSQIPEDLADACKFASQFAQKVFGGEMKGNWHHQYLVLPDGNMLDLTDGAGGTADKMYHDRVFWNNREHKKSLASNLPRVEKWVSEFQTIPSQ